VTTKEPGVDAREEELLREGFEQELAGIVSGVSPTELIIGAGRRIRRRRQAVGSTLTALGAVGVALGLVASGALGGAQGAVTPASSAKSATPAAKHSVTVDSAAYDAAHGLVGSGTVDGLAWHVALADVANPWATGSYRPAVGNLAAPSRNDVTSPPALSDSFPLIGLSQWDFENTYDPSPSRPVYYVRAGEMPADAGSVVVDYADGASATFPVISAAGQHLVAFAGPAGYGVAKISVYSIHGDLIAYSVPYNAVGVSPYMIDVTWHQAGKPLPPQGSVTFNGTLAGSPYTLRMTVNATGVCTDLDHGGTDTLEGCDTTDAPATNEEGAGWTSQGSASVLYGYSDPAVANVKVNLKHMLMTRPNLTLVPSTVKLDLTVVSKLGMTFWSAMVPADEQPVSYTTYDAQGKAIQTIILGP